ncbi:serine/threonine-protein kinase [Salix suchowensis]|nr:serine/threonine-protein kinase [Salix suchowensis]
MEHNTSSVNTKISKHTSLFGVCFTTSSVVPDTWTRDQIAFCQAEEFTARVEMIGHVRHRNLCADYGNLHQWLYGFSEQVSPLTWAIRMNIMRGIGKGLAYLHEDIEPKIIHQNLKPSHILLDHQWNPKINDFGITKLFSPQWIDVTIHSLETSGRIICARVSADQNHPQVYLVDWLTSMIELKRMLLLDRDIKHRPTMGDVIHMLEPRDLLLEDDRQNRIDGSSCRKTQRESRTVA